MHLRNIALILGTITSLVASQPHRHRHQHVRREAVVTMTACTVLGQSTVLSPSECTAGIDAAKYKFVGPAPVAEPTTTSSPPVAAAFFESTTATPEVAPTTSSSSSSTSVSTEPVYVEEMSVESAPTELPPSPPSPEVKVASKVSESEGSGADSPFPDGELDCGTVPTQYGAIAVDYLSLNGWIGLQKVEGPGTIRTGVKSFQENCAEGWMCSYACAAGYQKSQWPLNQPASGASVGGLECKNGKLHLTNPNFKTICIKGTGVSQVKNQLGENVAVCRTDYPGTEGETVPMNVSGGSTMELTCPDAANYFIWDNKPTSAQYYVNPKGVMAKDGCQWGQPGSGIGNDAPVNLGINTDHKGKSWFSILPNHPTNYHSHLDFSIEIQGDFGGDKCTYSGGRYCLNGKCNDDGVTCNLRSGTGTFVFI